MSTHRRSATAVRRSDPATQLDVERERLPGRTGLAIPALLLFASGTAAMVYQVLWITQLSLVVGVDVYVVTTGVSGFFAGLALGGALFGRWADCLARPFLLYALLELGIAVLSVATTLTLAHAARPFVALEERAGPLAWVLLFALVGVPAVLMGGTLPVLIRSRDPQPGQIGAAGGSLYAANTAGAIAGALVTSFVLLPLLGVRGAALAASAINLAAAIGALGLDRAVQPRTIVSGYRFRPRTMRTRVRSCAASSTYLRMRRSGPPSSARCCSSARLNRSSSMCRASPRASASPQ